ncbi:hypothetical protein [Bacillus wiedmannii]|uniref:hypothetical protein n=1 Tax=Bacillus wiedmannii TaxID=1890302 RepID=UPI000BEF5200|nr:hypothetical protein [Bacillus wiedmannii]PEM08551.1 hypothetical protein CN610_20070 [Bacillus wiedmannii]
MKKLDQLVVLPEGIAKIVSNAIDTAKSVDPGYNFYTVVDQLTDVREGRDFLAIKGNMKVIAAAVEDGFTYEVALTPVEQLTVRYMELRTKDAELAARLKREGKPAAKSVQGHLADEIENTLKALGAEVLGINTGGAKG